MFRLTQYRTDPDLCETLVNASLDTMIWLRAQGARFVPNFGRQSGMVNGKRRFFGRMPIEASGGGPGLVENLTNAAVKKGIEIRYATRAVDLIYDGETVAGVTAKQFGKVTALEAASVVLACGGFEANPEWRTRYLGPGWELAKVRGTRFNVGDGLRMALDIGAAPYGNWSGCHATGWDRYAPEFGDLAVGDQFEKHSYIFGLLINAEGKRFVDEGADFHSFTYAKYGAEVLKQTGQFAWQVFDSKVKNILRPEYRVKQVTKVTTNTLEELAQKLEGVNAEGFLKTVREFNAAVRTDIPFDHVIKDGRGTRGIEPPKTNWANPLDTPPFEAYATTCGITFTFGGLRIDRESGQVLDVHLNRIPGLYAAGEMVGGLFYFNYASGTGLVSGAVFGRIAGRGAARAAK
jgi:tricarballylate dehydrogenase